MNIFKISLICICLINLGLNPMADCPGVALLAMADKPERVPAEALANAGGQRVQKAVMLELDNVLLEPNETGCCDFLNDLISGQIEGYQNRLFEVLSTIKLPDTDNTKVEVTFKGKKLPKIWLYYYLGKITSQEAIKKSYDAIEDNTSWFSLDRTVLKKAASIAFDPKAEADIMEPTPDIYVALKNLKEKDIKLILFTNKNKETLNALKSKYKYIFELFGDNIVISETSKSLKPDIRAFKYVLDHYNLQADQCFAIESQQAYADKAKEIGITPVLFKKDKVDELIKIILQNSHE